MSIRTTTPRPPLSDFVDVFWAHEGNAEEPSGKERVLPTGTVELVVHLREAPVFVYDGSDPNQFETFWGAIVCGPYARPFVIDAPGRAPVLGVHFRPGGAYSLLGLPLGELRNLHVSLETLWGVRALELRHRLAEANTLAQRFCVLEKSLLSELARRPERHPGVAAALAALARAPQTRIADLAREAGVSARHFVAVFRDEVGLTPALYRRVQRFQATLRHVHPRPDAPWAELGPACGYYDQAHLIRDFQAFAGLSPAGYLRHDPRHPNHVPLAD